jgi:dTDP-4-amino-4,6-dideoxygalactose transaminase
VIPLLDLRGQYAALKPEIDRAVLGVLASGQYINGPNVRELEREIAEYVGTHHAVALNSGTDALHLALRALGIGRGDEVITSPFSFIATTEAIGIVGASPVFADIDPQTFTIDPRCIEAAITPRTRAIIPVHLYGLPAAMDEIAAIAARHHLAIVEDGAQAIGAQIGRKQAGSFGEFGCFSFFPSKNLGAFGDGGMLTTNDFALAARVRSLRAHGGPVKYHHEELGVNSRLDEIQAAILRAKLPYLESWIRSRRALAAEYSEQFAGNSLIGTPHAPCGVRHVFHQYTVRIADRDEIQKQLAAAGIQTSVYYPVPLHLQRVHADLGHAPGAFPHAEDAARQVLSLPIFPELPPNQRRHVGELLLQFCHAAQGVCVS